MLTTVSEGQRSFAMSEQNLYWYAIYTIPRWEKKVSKILDDHGIENYCPLHKVVKQWSDRKKTITEPLFKSYVFVRISDHNKWSLKQIHGIINFVYWLGKPAVVKDVEIVTIKKFLNEFNEVTVEEKIISPTSRVKIEAGLLMNYEGLVLEVLGNKAKVRIESLGLVLVASIEKKNLTII